MGAFPVWSEPGLASGSGCVLIGISEYRNNGLGYVDNTSVKHRVT